MSNKINEAAWFIIAVITMLMALYFLAARGMNDQDTLVLLFASLIAFFMFFMRRKRRISQNKKV